MKQNKSYVVIGITGGAGSGKSTIVEYIKTLIPVRYLHCDIIAHELMQPGGTTYECLKREYGTGILREDETRQIDREKLAAVAMATRKSRERLNELTHPPVRAEVEERLAQLKREKFSGGVIIEAALLLEAGFSELCDEVWYVYAPAADRIRRMKEHRAYSEEKINNILSGQLSEEEFRLRTDFIIDNRDREDNAVCEETKRRIKERLETMFLL